MQALKILSLSVLFCCPLFSQDVIKIKNGSFEDINTYSNISIFNAKSWFDSGSEKFKLETPADLISNLFPVWGIGIKTIFGEKYVSLVVRDNKTYESIGQKLTSPMLPGKAYKFSLYLCKAQNLLSKSRSTNYDANFNTPAILIVKGRNTLVEDELLRTPPVVNDRWLKYTFIVEPRKAYKNLILEAGFVHDDESYNGHILLDNVSDLIEVPMTENMTSLTIGGN